MNNPSPPPPFSSRLRRRFRRRDCSPVQHGISLCADAGTWAVGRRPHEADGLSSDGSWPPRGWRMIECCRWLGRRHGRPSAAFKVTSARVTGRLIQSRINMPKSKSKSMPQQHRCLSRRKFKEKWLLATLSSMARVPNPATSRLSSLESSLITFLDLTRRLCCGLWPSNQCLHPEGSRPRTLSPTHLVEPLQEPSRPIGPEFSSLELHSLSAAVVNVSHFPDF